jgi:tyrosyl-tRNA synthetase
MRLLSDLQSRGLLAQSSDPQLDTKLAALLAQRTAHPPAAYAGFDPTSDSLHVGNFIAILALMHAQRNGLRPIAIVGGATGLIGDPSGKAAERQLLTKERVADNVRGIQKVLERFLDFNHPTAPARIVNNLDWFGSMSAIDFLREVGKHFRIGSMLAKESVKARMESSDEGMSYTEFSYQLLQGYDFYKLYKEHGCVLQLGGSDQWGNITAGIDVIRKLDGESGNAFGVTLPLITTSSGQKFGKSEGNAVWLSAEKTSPYDFHQFWLRVEDADAERYLKYFTFLPLEEVAQLSAEIKAAPEKRTAQKRLADLMTTLVHGEAAAKEAASAAALMYGPRSGGGAEALDAASLEALAKEVPSFTVERAKIAAGWSPVDALRESGLVKSGGEAKRLIAQGGFYVNNQPWSDAAKALGEAELVAGKAILLRTGKKNYRIARVS